MKKNFFIVVFNIFWPTALYAQGLPNLLDHFQTALSGQQIIWPLVVALSAGFLTALSPCVYPLIPITLSVIGVRKYPSPLYGFFVAFSYTLGMAVVYSVLGIIFASIGLLTGSLMQHPLALIIIALIFLVMALSMLGFFNIALPQTLLSKLSRLGGQGIKGAFLTGLVAGLLAAPCTGPVLGVILTIIAEQKDVLWGLALMMAFSLGMGVPFLLLATFSSALLHMPKSGPWMDKIKYILGAFMMGAAIYYLGLALPNLLPLQRLGMESIWVLLVFGIALIISLRFFKNQAINRLQLVFGAAMLSFSIASMLAFDGHKEPHKIQNFSWHVIDDQTKDIAAFDRLLLEAKQRAQPVMIDFYADWCKACKELELYTFSEKAISEHLQGMFLIRIDSTKSSNHLSKIQDRFQVKGLPTVVLMGKDQTQDDERVVGFVPPEQFLPLLKKMPN